MSAYERWLTSRNCMYARKLRLVSEKLQNLFSVYDGSQFDAGCSGEAKSSKATTRISINNKPAASRFLYFIRRK